MLAKFDAVSKASADKEASIVAAMSASMNVDSPLADAGRDSELVFQGVVFKPVFGSVDQDLLEERARDAEDLANKTRQIHDLFVDVNNLVAEQGEMIDEMAGNVTDAKDSAEKANAHLDKALEHQAKLRKCYLALLLLIFIIALVVLVVTGVIS